MKKRLLAGLIAGALVLSGCSGLFEDNSLNARTHRYLDQHADEMKRLSEEQKRMYDMLAAVTIEPAKQQSKPDLQIASAFLDSIMNECGFGNKFGCNLDEIVKDPYKGRKVYIRSIKGVYCTVLSDYKPSKSISIKQYMEERNYKESVYVKVYLSDKYYHQKNIPVEQLIRLYKPMDEILVGGIRYFHNPAILNMEDIKDDWLIQAADPSRYYSLEKMDSLGHFNLPDWIKEM